MVELKAKSPCAGLLPVTHGGVTMRERARTKVTSVSPNKGMEASVAHTLDAALGVSTMPSAGRSNGPVLWVGQGQYFVLDAELPQINAAVTDQSDAWATVALEGEGALDVLARLCPLDLAQMDEGDVARSLVGHMACILIRRADGFEIMAFRSMASTLWHELEGAMRSVAARAGVPG